MSTSLKNWPSISIKAWPTSAPSDGTMPTTTATELGTRTQKLTITRGRQYEMDVDATGTCHVELRNDDGLLGANSKFQPRMPMQVQATLAGATTSLFAGYWESMPWTQPSPLESTSTLEAQDLLGDWSQRALQSSVTEYIMGTTTPALYIPSRRPLIGTAPGLTSYTAPGVKAQSGYSATFCGDTAFSYYSADTGGTTGLLNVTGAPSVPWNKPVWGVVSFSPNDPSDVIPIFTLSDADGYPTHQIYYAGGLLLMAIWYGDASDPTVPQGNVLSMSAEVSAVPHTILWGHDGSTMYVYIDGSTTPLMSSSAGAWPYKQIRQWSIGAPTNAYNGGGYGWSSHVSIGGHGTWSSSGATIYGVALYSGSKTPPNFGWGAIASQEMRGADERVADFYGDVQAWSNVDCVADADSSACIRPSSFGQTLAGFAQQISQSVGGRVYIDKAGVPRFRSRDLYQKTPAVPRWIFGSNQAAGEYVYTDAPQFAWDLTRVADEVQVQSPAGVALASSAATRFAQRRSMQVSSQTDDPVAQAGWLQGRYAKPVPRPAALKFEAGSNPSLWPMCLGVELGDFVQLNHRSPAAGQSVSMTGFVEGISHEIDSTAGQWTTTLSVSPNLATYWIVGSPTRGLVGQTTYLSWST